MNNSVRHPRTVPLSTHLFEKLRRHIAEHGIVPISKRLGMGHTSVRHVFQRGLLRPSVMAELAKGIEAL